MPIIITIDGPAGAGKTTTSKLLAHKLDYVYVDTGALYRSFAFEIKKNNINYENDNELKTLIDNLNIHFTIENNSLKIISEGKNIAAYIRTSDISMRASNISAKKIVRNALLDIQRNIAKGKNSIFEGRDMGTIVFPEADFKFFLYADVKTRALRRYNESNEADKKIEDIEKEITIRDKNDSSRKQAPLKPAKNAFMIDSSCLSIEEVVEKMIKEIKKV